MAMYYWSPCIITSQTKTVLHHYVASHVELVNFAPDPDPPFEIPDPTWISDLMFFILSKMNQDSHFKI